MPGIVRAGDSHAGHASPTPNPFHQSSYVASQSSVYVNGAAVIRSPDSTGCGDPVAGVSPTVFVEGAAVHRLGDATSGHGSWVPNSAATSSTDVFADSSGAADGPQGTVGSSITSYGACVEYDWNTQTCLDEV